jgi:hypothetical protein
MTMSFSEHEKAQILRTSRRILRDKDKPPGAPPSPEPLPLVIETEEQRWRREAEDFERQRTAERRRQERASSDRIITKQANDLALEARVSALEERVDAIEQAVSGFNGLAEGAAQFSDAVSEKMHALEALTARLDLTLEQLRGAHKHECDALRAQVTAAETAHTREMGLVTKQLADAQRSLDQREHRRDREVLAASGEATVVELQALRRDLAERNATRW